MRLQTILIILICLCSEAAAEEWASVPRYVSAQEESWIGLEGNNTIQMPYVAFSSPGANWTYPFQFFPVYAKKEMISGNIFGPAALAGFDAVVCISNFSIFNLLSALTIQENRTAANGKCSPIHLNSTGDAHFALEGVPSGLYTIMVVDAHNSTVFATTPALIAEGEIATKTPPEFSAGDIMPLTIETPRAWRGKSLTYGAIMISSQDYATAKLNLTTNGTEESLLTTISLDNNSMQVQGMPRISTDLLMNLTAILPQNCALAMQPSTEPEVELNLLTDRTWTKGEYILTSAVYSSGEGLMGLRQDRVEVV